MFYALLMRTSFVDYPGKICSTLFTRGCNMRCAYCHNPELSGKIPNLTTMDYSSEYVINVLKSLTRIKAVCITGGEPAIHDDLINDVLELKRLSLAVKVDTNGSRPEIMSALRKHIDYIAMDFKGLDTSLFSSITFETYLKSIEEMKKFEEYEFRITMFPDYVKERDFAEIAKTLKGAKRVAVQQYRKTQFSSVEPYNSETLLHFGNILSEQVGEVIYRGI
ncbi:MAG TPA: anaerobic ribonucleoside-triphosphate reductase activating protein [Mesotoga sp.]|nr:anaerobic ribonucleoside-triphosphate reductase activating protein [Mesotoga sp.]